MQVYNRRCHIRTFLKSPNPSRSTDAAQEDPLDTALSLSTVYDEFDENLLNEHDPYRSNFKSNIKVNTVIYRDGYCGRANTIAKYSEMNRLVCVRSWD